jgi:putative hydrolase of the HAD superfamily
MLSNVCCIVFDAVGTVIYPDPPVGEVYARVGRKYGSTLSEEQVQLRFRDAFQIAYQKAAATSEREEREAWRQIVSRVFVEEYVESLFEELFDHFGRAESWRCYPDVADTLAELSKRGFELVLASNFDKRLHAICDGHEALGGFSKRFISTEVGMFKSHPEFYERLRQATAFQNHEILMVGDDWENDVRSARHIGMPAVFLDRTQTDAITHKDNVPVISSLVCLLELLP